MRLRYTMIPPAFVIAVSILRPPAAPTLPSSAQKAELSVPVQSPAASVDLPYPLDLPPSTLVYDPDARMSEEHLRMQDAPAGKSWVLRGEVLRTMAHLLELAYMAFDQKRFHRCIELCEKILEIDVHYQIAWELKEDCERSAHIDGFPSLLAGKVEEWKKITDDDEQARIPWSESVRLPSSEEWAEISKRLPWPVRSEGNDIDDPDMLAIARKLDTMKIDLAFANAKLEDILSFIRDFSGLNVLLDAEVRDRVDPERIMTFKVKDMALKHALRLLLSGLGLDYVVTDEHVVLLTDPHRVSVLNHSR
jgi:hypothetical protein